MYWESGSGVRRTRAIPVRFGRGSEGKLTIIEQSLMRRSSPPGLDRASHDLWPSGKGGATSVSAPDGTDPVPLILLPPILERLGQRNGSFRDRKSQKVTDPSRRCDAIRRRKRREKGRLVHTPQRNVTARKYGNYGTGMAPLGLDEALFFTLRDACQFILPSWLTDCLCRSLLTFLFLAPQANFRRRGLT